MYVCIYIYIYITSRSLENILHVGKQWGIRRSARTCSQLDNSRRCWSLQGTIGGLCKLLLYHLQHICFPLGIRSMCPRSLRSGPCIHLQHIWLSKPLTHTIVLPLTEEVCYSFCPLFSLFMFKYKLSVLGLQIL